METYGWDTVFIVDLTVINKALEKAANSRLTEFSFSEQGFDIEGKFGSWQIVPGGGGKLLHLQLPITSGKLQPPGGSPVDLAGVTLILQISLELLPAPQQPGGKVLRFNFKSVGSDPSGDGVVTPVSVTDPSAKLTPLQQSALLNAVAQCLVANAGAISFVFATVNPLSAAAPWLRPVESDYCYFAVAGSSKQILAILSKTTAGDISALPRKVDPSIISEQTTAGLAISPELFLLHVLAPGLASSFKTNSSVFHLHSKDEIPKSLEWVFRRALGGGPILTSSGFGLPSVSKSGETYHPQVTSFTAIVEDTRVAIFLSGKCDMKMNIKMTFKASSNVSAHFDRQSGSFAFGTVGSPSFSKDISIPWYDHLLDIVTPVAEIILQACVAAIGSQLAGGIKNVAASANIADYAPKVVDWAGASGFIATDGGLASALYLRGDVH